jgi:FkbM family methyltransferase
VEIAHKTVEGRDFRFFKKGEGLHRYLKRWKPGAPPREPCLIKLLQIEVKPGMSIAEVGANIGYQTLQMVRVMKGSGRIFAFEPDSRNAGLLRHNLAVNGAAGMVEVFEVAVADTVGVRPFFISKKATNLNALWKTKHAKKPIEVSVTTLTEFFTGRKERPNFIKMDIEGAEVEVLRGLYTMASQDKFPCKILFEVHPGFYQGGRNLAEQLTLYRAIGFVPKYLISATTRWPKAFKERGYAPNPMTPKSKIKRSIFTGVSWDDAIAMAAHEVLEWCPIKKKHGKSVRFLMIVRES